MTPAEAQRRGEERPQKELRGSQNSQMKNGKSYPDIFDVAVIGGGHAGCESCLVAARMGASVVLITHDFSAVSRMSCNPSIGGIGKSHLVCEVDALGGEIGVNADYCGIQFRILNTKKGPAVQSFRVQCDKAAYSKRMHAILSETNNLYIIESSAESIVVENGRLKGVSIADGSLVRSKTVVVACGTFLNGTIHIGSRNFPGGRKGESASKSLCQSLQKHGIRCSRFKTGTPPRLDKRSLDFNRLTIQPGLEPAPFLSRKARNDARMFHVEHPDRDVMARMFHVEHACPEMRPWTPGTNQMPCYLTHTTTETHDIIRNNLKTSSLYGGYITSTGVRYCPSIEDKVVKFFEKDSHHVFLEPEGRNSLDIYPNGLSNSLPKEVQESLVRSIPGLEHSVFTDYAYAIEYDFFDPTQLTHALECKNLESVFLAGQVNGTTGYEEAAALGFVAGVNAVQKTRGNPPIFFSRSDSYIGVMVDDLVTKGVDEPYRIFTSRAEHRLLLRQDNAAFRMNDKARLIGVVSKAITDEVKMNILLISDELKRISTVYNEGRSFLQILSRPDSTYRSLPCARLLPDDVVQQVEIEAKYQGYIERERVQIDRMKGREETVIPQTINYEAIKSLRFESRQKLQKIKPNTLGQASRIPGIPPSDIAILSVWIKRNHS